MKTVIDETSGTMTLIPQCKADRVLLLHLMNCSDLTQFSAYIALEQSKNYNEMTDDLGVPVTLIDRYPVENVTNVTSAPNRLTNQSSSLIGFDRY